MFCLSALPSLTICFHSFLKPVNVWGVAVPIFVMIFFVLMTAVLAEQVCREVDVVDKDDKKRRSILRKYDELVNGIDTDTVVGRVSRLFDIAIKLLLGAATLLSPFVAVCILISLDFMILLATHEWKIIKDKNLKVATYVKYGALLVVEMLVACILHGKDADMNFRLTSFIQTMIWGTVVFFFVLNMNVILKSDASRAIMSMCGVSVGESNGNNAGNKDARYSKVDESQISDESI